MTDVFGYHALQLGLPAWHALRTNRMPQRWLAAQLESEHLPAGSQAVHLWTEFHALPFAPASVDLVVLPLSLEQSADPHATLREVERVLVPEGRVVICGLNPASLWGVRQRRSRWLHRLGWGQPFVPTQGDWISYRRLRDWLRLLGFEVESSDFGCWQPAIESSNWLRRLNWMNTLGQRWWPIFGAAYCIVAVKRVRAMTLLGPAWKSVQRLPRAPVVAARKALHEISQKTTKPR